MASELAHWSNARRELELARTVDEVKDIRDKAEALRLYSKQAGESLEVQNAVAEIKLRAERKAGKLLGQSGPKHGGDRRSVSRLYARTLKDLDISRFQSHRWQRVASISRRDFEAHVNKTKNAGRELTTAGILRIVPKQARKRSAAKPRDVASCTVADLEELVSQGTTFATIYADPPWPYGNQATRAATSNHYKTMTLEDLAALPVAELAAHNAHLHLWTTNAFLHDALHLIPKWGFEYKSCLVWVKPQMGLGNYWRLSHEFLLFGIRGQCPFLDRGQQSWVSEPRTKHSQKPEKVRKLIEKVSPAPRLELFGRRCTQGWTVWGNEIARHDLSEDAT